MIDIINHVCGAISFIFIGGMIVRSFPINHTLTQKILFGLLAGIFGSVLMLFSINLSEDFLVDFRHYAILIAALYGGVIPAVIATIVLCLNKILFFAGSFQSVLISLISMSFVAILASFITRLRISTIQKWIYMLIFSALINNLVYGSFYKWTPEVFELIFNYWLLTAISGTLVLLCTTYIYNSNKRFNELKHQSKTDFLTGLYNVRQFDEALNASIDIAIKNHEKLSLLMIDIDYFKKVNDTYGHPAGDEVLKQLGTLLKKWTRSKDLVSRNGGEEFTVLMPNCQHDIAIKVADRIRIAVENHHFILPEGEQIKFTTSIGVSTFLETTQSPDLFLKQADDAVYEAKRTGRNRVCSVGYDGNHGDGSCSKQ